MIDYASLASLLGRVSHFQTIPPDRVEEIVRVGRVRQFKAREIIFLENEPSAGLFVLLKGRVQLCKLSLQGHVSILTIFEPVIMFNEVAALDSEPNPATTIALEDSTIWQAGPQAVHDLVMRYPQVGIGLLRVLARRNRLLVAQFEDLSFRTVLARAAKLLVELSDGGQTTIDRRKHPNHQMAARIATVPEAFSRSLKVFRTNDDIIVTDRHIRVVNPLRLMEVAQIGPKVS